MKKLGMLLFSIAILSSCVTQKIHGDLKGKYDEVLSKNQNLEEENQKLLSECNEWTKDLKVSKDELQKLREESDLMNRKLDVMNSDYANLKESYDLLVGNNSSQIAKNAQKNLELLTELEKSKTNLEAENEKLKSKEKKIAELEYLMKEREKYLNNMKLSLTEALRGFEGKGLTVEQRNGKVYVSLENRLLFAPGSWNVNSKGKEAIRELTGVLSKEEDFNIIIEGHTDSDPFSGSGSIVDNWDLSVKRATSIVKLITSGGVNEERISASGRGEFVPVASNKTVEGKAKNRRIEVIIEPDLSKIEAMLNQI